MVRHRVGRLVVPADLFEGVVDVQRPAGDAVQPLADLSDLQVLSQLEQLIASLGRSHNRVWFFRHPDVAGAYFVRGHLFGEEGAEPFWLEHLPAHGAAYVRLRATSDTPGGESLAAFGARVGHFLRDHSDVSNLVIDLRGNMEGNTYLYNELLRQVIAFDAHPGNQAYAIIDRLVGSAAMNFTIQLEQLTQAVLVGEATFAAVEMHGDGIELRLPYSGGPLEVSSVIWNLSSPRDRRRWIAPQVPVSLTAEDFFENRDPKLETVFELIRRRGT